MATRCKLCLLAALVCAGSAARLEAQLPNAWQINDNASSLGVIQYVTNLSPAQVSAATNSGQVLLGP